MHDVPLGSTGVRVSQLCAGTMAYGGQADDAESAAMYRRCRDAGINFFDCADVYADGRSEEILGHLMAAERDEIVLATKAYFPTNKDDVNARGASRRHLVSAVEASLRRLVTDRIDLYYIHRFDDDTDLTETLRCLDDLVRQGKILYTGASNFAAWQVAKALGLSTQSAWASFCCIQPMYNLLKRQAEVELLPMAVSEGLAVFPYSPLAGGLLTGKYRGDKTPADARLLANDMYKRRYADPTLHEAATRFAALAQELGSTPASLAVAWVAAHPAVTAPIIGGRTADQLDDSLRSVEIDLTPDLRDRLATLVPEPPPATDRSDERTAGDPGSVVISR